MDAVNLMLADPRIRPGALAFTPKYAAVQGGDVAMLQALLAAAPPDARVAAERARAIHNNGDGDGFADDGGDDDDGDAPFPFVLVCAARHGCLDALEWALAASPPVSTHS